MKVALVQCPGWGRDCPPYTMALLSAVLRKEGHFAFCFDLNNALYCSGLDEYRKMWDDKDFYSFWGDEAQVVKFIQDNQRMIDFQVERILNSGAKIIGFTVHFSSSLVSLEVARRIKQRSKDRLIVFGGPDCCRELRGESYIKEDAVDVVVIGEGELTLLELAGELEQKGHIDFCEGTLLKRDQDFIDCGDRAVIEDLDSLPFPDYSDFSEDINLGLYRQPERLELFDSRGCITHCHFCSEWQFWKKFRSKSGKRMFEEIQHHLKSFPGVNYFYFIGSLLNGNVKALSKFCELIIENGLKVRWAGQAIVRPQMTYELLSKMRQAGCEWLGYGIESGSQRIVDRMNKHFLISDAERVLRDTHKIGISTQVNFMFGLPTETEEDFNKTLNFLKRNRKHIDSILASQSFCVIDKGTYLHIHPDEFAIKDQDHHLYWEADNGKNTYLERFKRYEKFCNVALSLGVPQTSGVLRVKPDKWLLLGDYYKYKKDYRQAMEYYKKSNQAGFPVVDEIIKELERQEKVSIKKDGEFLEEDFERIMGDERFSEKQKKIIDILYMHRYYHKLTNYIQLEEEKRNRSEYMHAYPYWLVIDPTNFCTLKCPFCPTGQGRNSRTKTMMSFENFRKVLDELGPYLIHIDFCNWGEPLLNREIYNMIRYAKKFNIDTKIDTNLNHFNEEDAEKMIRSGLDKVIVSIDGVTPETYSKYRVGGDFYKAMNNLKLLLKKKKEMKSFTPYISWQFLVFRHNEHEIKQVKSIGRHLGVDHIGITKAFIGDKDWFPLNERYSHYRREDVFQEQNVRTDKFFKSSIDKTCNWLWEAIIVNSNGSVSPCCSVEYEKNDFGNIFTQPFIEIWNNQKYRAARRYVKNRKVPDNGGNNVCIGCAYLGLTNLDILSCHSLF